MKVFIVLCVMSLSLAAPEAPSAPYAPSGWRPQGPAFELPTRTENKPTQDYGPPQQPDKTDVEITEEELQYTGDIATTEGTTPFLEYGPPASEQPEDFGTTTTSGDVDDDLSVQGLPSTEPAKQFRNLPENDVNQRLRSRNQRVRVQPQSPRNGRIQQQFFQGSQFQQQGRFQQRQFTSISGNLQAPPQNQQFVPHQQFARVQQIQRNPAFGNGFVQFGQFAAAPAPAARQNGRRPSPAFNQRFTSQRQETLNSYGTPAQEYGPPANAYGPPQSELPQEEVEQVDQPEELPQEEPAQLPEDDNEETTEGSADPDDEEETTNVAVSNAVATGRYVVLQNGRAQKLRAGRTPKSGKLRVANVQQLNEPVYTYNQFGQLIRIL